MRRLVKLVLLSVVVSCAAEVAPEASELEVDIDAAARSPLPFNCPVSHYYGFWSVEEGNVYEWVTARGDGGTKLSAQDLARTKVPNEAKRKASNYTKHWRANTNEKLGSCIVRT